MADLGKMEVRISRHLEIKKSKLTQITVVREEKDKNKNK